MENSSPKLNMLSEIFRDIGQVLFASAFVGPIFSGSAEVYSVFWGFLFALLAWSFSLTLSKDKQHE